MIPTKTGTMTNATWSTAANWGGVSPAANDNLIMVSGTVDVNGENYSATQLDELQVASTFARTIGSAGTPLRLDLDPGILTYYGTGASAFFDGAYGTIEVDTVVLQTNAFVFGTVTASTCTTMIHRRGRLVVAGVATVTTLQAESAQSIAENLVINSGATVTTLKCTGTQGTNSGTATNVDVYQGSVLTQAAGASSTTIHVCAGARYVFNGGTGTTIFVHSGGVLDFSQSSSQRTCTTIWGLGGTIIAREKPNFAAAPTYNPRGANADSAFLSAVTIG